MPRHINNSIWLRRKGKGTSSGPLRAAEYSKRRGEVVGGAGEECTGREFIFYPQCACVCVWLANDLGQKRHGHGPGRPMLGISNKYFTSALRIRGTFSVAANPYPPAQPLAGCATLPMKMEAKSFARRVCDATAKSGNNKYTTTVSPCPTSRLLPSVCPSRTMART